MRIKVGIDIVFIPRFKKTIAKAGKTFLERVFLPSELKNQDPIHLAGIFASKEAVMKALLLPVNSWQNIIVSYNLKSQPKITILSSNIKIKDCSLSIAHDGNYAIAQFVATV